MSKSGGIYTCPLCGKHYYGNLDGPHPFVCTGVREVSHQPMPVIRTHDAVGSDSFAPVRHWSQPVSAS